MTSIRQNFKYMFLATICVCGFGFALSAHAQVQYVPSIKSEKTAEDKAQSSAPVYSPYVQQQMQGGGGAAPAQTAPAQNNALIENYDIGGALMNDYIRKSSQNPTANQLDADAPKLNELPPIATIPDDPDRYCMEYEKNNPQKADDHTQLEQLLNERIKPVKQINPLIAKTCIVKMREIAEQMLVDYSSYKRNELIMRAQQGKGDQAALTRIARELPTANMNYSNYASSECSLSRQGKAADHMELHKMVQSCIVQMLKKRVQQVAAM